MGQTYFSDEHIYLQLEGDIGTIGISKYAQEQLLEVVYVEIPSTGKTFKVGDEGTRNSATNATPVNMNAGSGKTATGAFEYGADLDGGAATLSGGAITNRFVLSGTTDLVSKYFNFEQDLIITKNRTFTIWVGGSGTGTYYITVHFHYHRVESA